MRTAARRGIASSLVLLLLSAGAACSAPSAQNGPTKDGGYPPPVLLVGIDGFRWDYLDRFRPPHLLELAKRGALAERLVPSFPSKTFPNHYSLATGLVPDHHGIVSNNIRDPELGSFSLSNREAVQDGRWWGGEPIWTTVQEAGMPAAALFWPGSEAEIDGVRPTFWTPYDGGMRGEVRIGKILGWLALPPKERPRFLTLYFSRVDSAGHRHGPLAEQTRKAVLEVDALLGELMARLEERDQEIHWVIVSDHGMSETSPERVVLFDEHIETEDLEVIDLSPVLALAPKEGADPEPGWRDRVVATLDALEGVSAYRREDLPEHLRHGSHPRVPPVLALAEEGWRFNFSERERLSPQTGPAGQHGYDPTVDSMGGLLLLAGPRIEPASELGAVDNVDVYSLMCELLGIVPAPNDGSIEPFRAVLRQAPGDRPD